MKPHIGDEKFKIARGDVGQGVCPVFEDSLVDGLRLTQMPALVRRNPRPQNVMMTAFDHVDGVDLHITKMLDRRQRGVCAAAERFRRVQSLDRKSVGWGKGVSVRV